MSNVLLSYREYRDSYGLVHPSPNTISHNGIRFTSEALVALKNQGELDSDTKNSFYLAIRACEIEPGLFRRHPTSHLLEQEGPDDYYALGLIAYILDAQFIAQRVVNYGTRNKWNFNNVNPGKLTPSSFLGRQQQLVAHLYFASGLKPPLISKIWWLFVVCAALFNKKENQDGWILTWMLVKVSADVKCRLVQRARKSWIKKFKKVWPYGVGSVLGSYFNNPNHPSAKFLVGEYG